MGLLRSLQRARTAIENPGGGFGLPDKALFQIQSERCQQAVEVIRVAAWHRSLPLMPANFQVAGLISAAPVRCGDL